MLRILGFGNVADAVEILAVGYMLTSYEDMERKLTPWEGSTSFACLGNASDLDLTQRRSDF